MPSLISKLPEGLGTAIYFGARAMKEGTQRPSIVKPVVLNSIFILLLAFSLACANEPPVADQASSSSLSAEQVEQIVSKALETQAMKTAAAPAGPTSEEIGTIVSKAY